MIGSASPKNRNREVTQHHTDAHSSGSRIRSGIRVPDPIADRMIATQIGRRNKKVARVGIAT